MTVDFTTSTASLFETAFEAIAARLRSMRARRSRRIALVALMDMDAARLDDLGIDAADVMHALARRDHPGAFLAGRRASRSVR